MAIIKCKMCGGDIELSADKTFGTCEYCGCTMTLPKVDDDQRAAAFNRGNHFRRIGEFDKALAVYERIVAEDNTDAEAHWCCALCRFGIEYVEDPTTYEWLPTCHRASFDSILEDVDYLAAVEYSDGITRRQYQKDGAKIAEVQRAVLATSQKEEPFDVFICYKESDENGNRTVDSTLAQDIYYQLKDKGYRVFFSRITLEDKAGAEYEPYIFAALNSAKVMIVVGTKPEHFSAVWVKNEWSRFLALMRKDRSKLLLPCYRDVDPYDLPEQLSVLQSYDMAKIGFIQDLIRGVSKVLNAEKEQPTVKETVIVQSEGGSNIAALLKRGQMALQDNDWSRADEFYERVLDQNAECAEAFLGKLLAKEQCSSLDAYVRKYSQRPSVKAETLCACDEDTKRINASVERYSIPGLLDPKGITDLYAFDRSYNSCLRPLREETKRILQGVRWDKLFQRAISYAHGDLASEMSSAQESIESALNSYIQQEEKRDKSSVQRITAEYSQHMDDADKKIADLYESAAHKREESYQEACHNQEIAKTSDEYKSAAKGFQLSWLIGYKDCDERAKQCGKLSEETKLEEDARFRKKAEEQQRKKQRTKMVVAATIAVVVVCVAMAKFVIIPMNKYSNAESLLEAGEYDDAIAVFTELGDYKDSREQAENAQKEKWYRDGITALEEEKYSSAIALLEKVGDYKDAKEKIKKMQSEKAEKDKKAKYDRAMSAIKSKNYDSAHQLLVNLKGYKDVDSVLEHFYYVPYEVDYYSSYSWKYVFEYSDKGLMTQCKTIYSDKTETILCNKEGVVDRSSDNTITYKYESKKISESHKRSDGTLFKVTIYDKYGNEIIKNTLEDNTLKQERKIKTDEHHNMTSKRINNTYSDGNLTEVRVDINNLHQYSEFKYKWFYKKNASKEYLHVIWRNIRIICGENVWNNSSSSYNYHYGNN